MKTWKNLSPTKKLHLKLQALQDPLFFWENEYFCGEKLWNQPGQEVTQRKILQEFYRVDPTNQNIRLYNELIIQAGMRSSKTFIAGCIGAYELFKLIQLGNPDQGITPAQYYGLAKGSQIFILNVAAKEEQAKDTIYAQIQARIEENPYFRSEEIIGFDYDNDVHKLRMNFEAYKVVVLAIGSNAKTGVGRTVKAALIDELNKFMGSADYLSGSEMYKLITKSTNTFQQRLDTTIINENIKVVVASPMYEGDIVNKKISTAHLTPTRLAYEVPTWVLHPGKTKEALMEECKDDMNDFLAQYGGVALGAHVEYFKKKERIKSCMNPKLKNWEIKNIDVRDEVTGRIKEGYVLDLPEKIPTGTYALAGDPSLKNDAFGISIWHREFREVAPDRWDDFYVGDSFIRLVPIKKIEHIKDVSMISGEIDPFKIKTLCVDACRRLPIEVAAFDTWMFPSVTQAIENCGVPVIQNIVDKEEYDVFKDILYRKRAEMSQYPFVIEELSRLILKHGKKVDHPSGGSKDVADSSANCVFYLTGEWEARKMKKTAKNKYVNPIKGFNPLFFG